MNKLPTVMIWVGILAMLLSGVMILFTWIHVIYETPIDALWMLLVGIIVGAIGIVLYLYGALRGKN
jgi:drug/metabolite transporter (DMT)-like permease